MTNFIDRGLDKMLQGDRKVLSQQKPNRQWSNIKRKRLMLQDNGQQNSTNQSSQQEVADYPDNDCMQIKW